MPDLTELDALDLSARVASGEICCAEIMQAYLQRIRTFNPGLNALVALRPDDELLAEAHKADISASRGWLHGLPIAIKDLSETAGIATTFGSPLHAGHVPSNDCDMVRRIRAAGAIIIGKSNSPEFGVGSHTYNPVYGTTVNPYDPALCAGGSSGGAAAALAAHLVPIADGSDMMGSLRNPAAFCNVYGFRPTSGLLPLDGPTPSGREPETFATHGPMARSVCDLARFLDTLATPAKAPLSEHRLDAGLFSQAVRGIADQDMTGLRIGWLAGFADEYPIETGVLSVCEQALGTLQALGAEVEPVTDGLRQAPTGESFDPATLFPAWRTLRAQRIAWEHQPAWQVHAQRRQMKPELRWEIESGLSNTPAMLEAARRSLSEWVGVLERLFRQFDLLCLPSAAVFPFPTHRHWPAQVAGRRMRSYHEWMSVSIPASLAGLPCLAVPAGFEPKGRPAGLQLIGPRKQDVRVLAAGQRYHLATDWPRRRPPGPLQTRASVSGT